MNEQGEKIGQMTEKPSKGAPQESLIVKQKSNTMISVPDAHASPSSVPSSFVVTRSR